MKGRLYDPELGRFIQADDLVESDATQGLNRYSYVLNNPLSLTDPTGHLSTRQWVAIAIAVVAAYFGQYYFAKDMLAASFAVTVAGGFASAYVATGSWRAGLWGAFAAGVFWGIGTGFNSIRGEAGAGVFGSGFTSGQYAAKVAAHGAAGGVLSELQGGNFGHGFLSAGATQAVSPMIEGMPAPAQFVASAAVGGTVSEATGGSFANGAVTAAFQFLFNSAVHKRDERALVQKMVEEQIDKYNPTSIAENAEYSGAIYKLHGKLHATPAIKAACAGSEACASDIAASYNVVPKGGVILADWHTHGNMPVGDFSRYNFSEPDFSAFSSSLKQLSIRGQNQYIGAYVGTASGHIRFLSVAAQPMLPDPYTAVITIRSGMSAAQELGQ